MEIINLYPGSFASNCYLLVSGSHAAIADPSLNAERLLDELRSRHLTLDYILLTHGHFDHVLALDELRDACGVSAYIHEADAELLSDSHKNGFSYFFGRERVFRPAERTLTHGNVLTLGDERICVVHTPGHTKGSVCYQCDGGILLTGDTLFDGAYGRFDLYGGDARTLYDSLRSLHTLPKDLTIYPGHGAHTRLGDALDGLSIY